MERVGAEKVKLFVEIIVALIMAYAILKHILPRITLRVNAGRISTTELVNRIYNFCEAYSGRTMYPYQAQFSKRVIRSVLENDGAEITALFSRQSGKTETISITVGGLMIILPQLANMPMFANDKRFMMFKDGFWVGIFAPSQRQAQITYSRMKSRLQCKEAIAVLNDPDFKLSFTTSNGQTVRLSNGSFVTAISASDGSNIEGESFKFIIMEECQDISNYKIRKSIHPMGASYNATMVKIGTATTFKGDFYEAIQRNKDDFENKRIPIRNHFEYDYTICQKYNERYRKYVEREKRSLGENSDEFQMSYLLKWIIARGMFVDLKVIEENNCDPLLGRVQSDYVANHVAGIDIGGGGSESKDADSTVITITEVDWDSPVLMESSYNEETQQEEIYLAYNTYIKDWLEITPLDADDYEEQFTMIMSYLSLWRISRAVVDATRESSIAHRLKASVSYEVIPFVFSPKSKSELYKHLDTEIKTGRARIPYDEETQKSPECKKFMQQLSDLQKSYSGQNLVVSHPKERGAHDDYTDSWALSVYGCKTASEPDNTETRSRKNVFDNQRNGANTYGNKCQRRNRLTARRR